MTKTEADLASLQKRRADLESQLPELRANLAETRTALADGGDLEPAAQAQSRLTAVTEAIEEIAERITAAEQAIEEERAAAELEAHRQALRTAAAEAQKAADAEHTAVAALDKALDTAENAYRESRAQWSAASARFVRALEALSRAGEDPRAIKDELRSEGVPVATALSDHLRLTRHGTSVTAGEAYAWPEDSGARHVLNERTADRTPRNVIDFSAIK